MAASEEWKIGRVCVTAFGSQEQVLDLEQVAISRDRLQRRNLCVGAAPDSPSTHFHAEMQDTNSLLSGTPGQR
jgi:hypothetical protein